MTRAVVIACVIVLAAGCFSEHPFSRGEDDGTGGGQLPLVDLSFSQDIKPILAKCTACHAAGAGGWTYDGGANAYGQAISVVNLGNPSSSPVLVFGSGSGHDGGTIFNSSSDSYNAILAWITEGAQDN